MFHGVKAQAAGTAPRATTGTCVKRMAAGGLHVAQAPLQFGAAPAPAHLPGPGSPADRAGAGC